jgi:hypothetical protein
MNIALGYLVVLFIIAIALDFIFISGWKKYHKLLQEQEIAGIPINKLQLLKQSFYGNELIRWAQPVRRVLTNVRFRAGLLIALELGLLAVWSISIGWDFLDMNPRVVPSGHDFNSSDEFGATIQANYFWSQALKCGWCAVWNGFQRGGYPALADIQGSMLHPIVILTTLLWGVVNGVKITLVLSFWFAGVAQWWIARELNLGWMPRMWSAAIVIAGGHLAGRMEAGVYSVVLSTAMASLVLAALIRLARTSALSDAVILGILTASAIVSGQGYIQIGLIGILPVAIYFFIPRRENTLSSWKNYLIAAGIALLLAAPLLIPLTHFSPNIVKDMDPEFKSAQPLSYLPLNLVIDDPSFFRTDLLRKLPYPYLYTLYIGWIPVVLAIFAFNKIAEKDRKFILFMGFGTLMEFLLASAVLLKLSAIILPQVNGIRYSQLIAGLAIPLILGLSAYGLEKFITLCWSALGQDRATIWKTALQFVLLIPLIYSLQSCFQFSQVWIGTKYLPDDIFKTLEALKTEDLQWVAPPFGEHAYVAPAIEMGMKLSPGILPWHWRDREPPQAVRYVTNAEISSDRASLSEPSYYMRDNNPYAGIQTGDKVQPCIASGSGGFIEVTCVAEHAGKLIVKENSWTGWQAWVDGKSTQLNDDQWLEVAAPAGWHKFTFSYLPWDVPLGLILFTIGCVISIQLLIDQKRND